MYFFFFDRILYSAVPEYEPAYIFFPLKARSEPSPLTSPALIGFRLRRLTLPEWMSSLCSAPAGIAPNSPVSMASVAIKESLLSCALISTPTLLDRLLLSLVEIRRKCALSYLAP